MVKWIDVQEQLPDPGENVILYFRDTVHTMPVWPKTNVMAAWRGNISKQTPDGEWVICGRQWNIPIEIGAGIAWMPMPEPPEKEFAKTPDE